MAALMPQSMQRLLQRIPPLQHLVRLLCKLPALSIVNTWPTDFLMHLPLRILTQRPLHPLPIPDIPLSTLLGDCIHRDWYSGTFTRLAQSEITLSSHKKVMRRWYRDIVPTPALQYHFDPEWLRKHDCKEVTVDAIPTLTHWLIPLSKSNSIETAAAKPSMIRQYWRSLETELPHPPLSLGPKYPYALPSVRWKAFWKAPVPHIARTPWWRLLIDKLPYRARLHRRQPSKVITNICYICNQQNRRRSTFHSWLSIQMVRLGAGHSPYAGRRPWPNSRPHMAAAFAPGQ